MADEHRILVVDDEPGARELLAEFLQYHGYAVTTAEDGQAALELLGTESVDLVVSDVDMPRLNGTQLLAKLHALYPKLPVLLITGKPSLDIAIKAMQLGAVDFLTKPFDLNQLRAAVLKLLPEKAALNRTMVMEAPERVIGGYLIRRTISEGAMGIIFEVERNGQRYAMKLIRQAMEQEEMQRELLERFIREAEIAQQVKHPNIVEIIDFGMAEEELVPFIVMEYIDGLSLDLVNRRLPRDAYADRARLLVQIADALACIHDHGVCHRDVKPSNVLVTDRQVAKVTDFGVARLPNSDLTMHDQILGSPLYMAPESFYSAQVDHRADIFSFGILAYEFLVGALPFDAENITSVAALICNSRPLHPRRRDKHLDPVLAEMLARCLKKQPAERYASLHEAEAVLKRFVETEATWQGRIRSLAPALRFSDDWS